MDICYRYFVDTGSESFWKDLKEIIADLKSDLNTAVDNLSGSFSPEAAVKYTQDRDNNQQALENMHIYIYEIYKYKYAENAG